MPWSAPKRPAWGLDGSRLQNDRIRFWTIGRSPSGMSDTFLVRWRCFESGESDEMGGTAVRGFRRAGRVRRTDSRPPREPSRSSGVTVSTLVRLVG